MAKALCWDLLSAEERTSCIGQARSLNCCSQNAWDVAGPLQEYWNSRVQPQINNLVIQNYKQVFGKKGVHAALAFHLFLLSPSLDSSTAKPTVLILTTDKKAASRAKKLLLKHDMFKSMNTGFDIYFESKPLFFRAGDDNDVYRFPSHLDLLSLCGASALVVPSSSPSPSSSDFGRRSRSATILCCFYIEGRQYAVLPAHVFYPEIERVKCAMDTFSDTDSQPSDSGESNLSHDEIDSGFHSSSLTPHQECHGLDTTSNDEIPLRHDVFVMIQSVPVLLGHLEPALELPSGKPLVTISRDVDFALVAVENSVLLLPNRVDIPGKGIVPVVGWKSQVSDGPALIISKSSGSLMANMSGTEGLMVFPWSSRPQRVWQLTYTLPPGDSGSLVVSLDGEIVGMAIASSPEMNLTYVMPAEDIFEIMWHSVEEMPSLVTANPQLQHSPTLLQSHETVSEPLDQRHVKIKNSVHENKERKDNGGNALQPGGSESREPARAELSTERRSITRSSLDQWLPEEDEALERLVRFYDHRGWYLISKEIPDKSPEQCRNRYNAKRRSSTKLHEITPEESSTIQRLVNEMEDRYTEIAERLAKHTPAAVNQWYSRYTQQTWQQPQRQQQLQTAAGSFPLHTTGASYRCTSQGCDDADLNFVAEDTFRAHLSLMHPWEDQDTVIKGASHKATRGELDDLLQELTSRNSGSPPTWPSKISNPSRPTKQQQLNSRHDRGVCSIDDQYGYHFKKEKEILGSDHSSDDAQNRSPLHRSILESIVFEHSGESLASVGRSNPPQTQHSFPYNATLYSPMSSPSLVVDDLVRPLSTSGPGSGFNMGLSPSLAMLPSRISVDSGYFSVRDSVNSFSGMDTDRHSKVTLPSKLSKSETFSTTANGGNLSEYGSDEHDGQHMEGGARSRDPKLEELFALRRSQSNRPKTPPAASDSLTSHFSDASTLSATVSSELTEQERKAKRRKQFSKFRSRVSERRGLDAIAPDSMSSLEIRTVSKSLSPPPSQPRWMACDRCHGQKLKCPS